MKIQKNCSRISIVINSLGQGYKNYISLAILLQSTSAERMLLVTATSTLLVLLCLTTQSTAQVDCSNITGLINAGDCSFYDCLNTRFQCGPTDYPLAYGKKYCLRFASQSSCFTEEVSEHRSSHGKTAYKTVIKKKLN